MISPVRFMGNNLLPTLVITLSLGIVHGTNTAPAHALFLPTFWLLSAIIAIATWRQRPTIALLTSLLLFFICGTLIGAKSTDEPGEPHHIYHLINEEKDVVAVGRLTEMAAYDNEFSSARVALSSIRLGPDYPFQPTTGKILLRVKGQWPSQILPGDLLAVRASLQLPHPARVPGSFDYARELARQDIWVTGYVRNPVLIHRVHEEKMPGIHLRFLFERLRARAGLFLDSVADDQDGALYRAILLGDRSRIPDETVEGFRASGTLHILAISGLHLTIIAGLVFGSLSWLLRRSVWLILHCNIRKVAGLISLLFLIGYTLLAGGNIPVVRACIISGVLILAFCGNRGKSLSSAIAFGAMLILTVSPQAIYTASFQLSFAAIIAIVTSLPGVQRLIGIPAKSPLTVSNLLTRLGKWLGAALLVSCTAVLGTLPIVLNHFHRFPLAGPIANLFIEPLICLWALPCGILSLLAIPFSPHLAKLLLKLGSPGLYLATSVTDLVASMPETTIWLAAPPFWVTFFYYLFFWLLLATWSYETQTKGKVLLPGAFFITVLLLFFPQRFQDKLQYPAIYILDVGQGSSAVILDKNRLVTVIDGGSSSYRQTNVGERLIAPFLWTMGYAHINSIVLTHPDGDHTNGVDFLLSHFQPEKLYVSTMSSGNRSFQKMLDHAKKHGVTVQVANHKTIFKQQDVSLSCLANTDSGQLSTRNEGLVLKAQANDRTMLFPGDIEKESEIRLVNSSDDLCSDILLAPHHGSRTSGSLPFLEAVMPQAVVVSASASRSLDSSTSPVAGYALKRKIPFLPTSQYGTVRIVVKSNELVIQSLVMTTKNPLRRPAKWLTRERIGSRER